MDKESVFLYYFKNMENIDAVIFDMDGVIFDSERITRIMWKKAGEEFNVKDVDSTVAEVTGRSFSDTCSYLKEKYGENFPAVEFRTRCSELFHSYADKNGLPFMSEAKETLDYLKQKGYTLALASSTRQAVVERELKQASIYDYFKTITCGDMVAHSKPDPEIYIKAAESLGADCHRCIAIEDSPNGIISSYRAGMMSVMVVDQIKPTEELKKILYKLCYSLREVRSFL